MDCLRVRTYGVRFGEAILISVPDRTSRGNDILRHILIDVGNVAGGEGGQDAVFAPVIQNVLEVLDGRPLDLYVMTHEHLDHVQGLFYAAQKLGLELEARYAWLTASAAEDYYERFPGSKKRLEIYASLQTYLQAAPHISTPYVEAMMANNDPGQTGDCVAYLRKLAGEKHTSYVYRGCGLSRRHPFRDTHFEIWAPEEDTSEYYGSFKPMVLGAAPATEEGAPPALNNPKPPRGVDMGAFYNLVDIRRNAFVDNLLAIDYAANNTSVVFSLEWHGWRLLFTGDAEQRSWKTMDKYDQLKPVHYFKVSHHGSANGIPAPDLLEQVLPATPPDGQPRQAVVSTYPDTYNHVPASIKLQAALGERCTIHYVNKDTVADGQWVDVEFAPLD